MIMRHRRHTPAGFRGQQPGVEEDSKQAHFSFRGSQYYLFWPKLSFLVLFFVFGAGITFRGTRNKFSFHGTRASVDIVELNRAVETSYSTNDGDANNGTPQIAWLMSFPNSGTSYTTFLMRKVTGHSTASNYGIENVGEDGTSVAVIESSKGGPFWTDPKTLSRQTSGYVLTKTHCGGRCLRCPPEAYIENQRIFATNCFSGNHFSANGDGSLNKTLGSLYSEDAVVARAIHLIRSPFDNIVSRFNNLHNRFVRLNQTEQLDTYPRSEEGFRAFCKDMGELYHNQAKAARFYRDVFNDVKNVPCYAEFFKYIQWHNLAFATTWDMEIPTLILHYEEYEHNFDRTKSTLLSFLEQAEINEPPLFQTGKTYKNYYSAEEIQAVSVMFSKLAISKTWQHTKHYFNQ